MNIHIVYSPFKHESRILKESRSLIKLKLVDSIKIIAYNDGKSPEHENIDSNTTLWRIPLELSKKLKIKSEFAGYLEFSLKALFRNKYSRNDIINCHSLHVLPIGVLIKIFHRTKLIYDAHELETEVVGAKGIKKVFAKIMEQMMMPFVNELIVVSDSIANWYQIKYKLMHVTVIKNIPNKQPHTIKGTSNLLREKFNIPENDVVGIYQGVLAEHRGVKEILNAFIESDTHKHIVFMGFAGMADEIERASQKYPNIHFLQAVKPEDVPRYTSGADFGIHIIPNSCLNHYYCLPNKVYEYILSGIPPIVSDFPDLSKVVKEYDCGWCIEPSKKGLTAILKTIDKTSIAGKKNNLSKASENYSWENQENLYVPLLKRISKTL